MAGVRECEREIARHERLAVTWSGARDGDEHRPWAVFVHQRETQAPQRFDDFSRLFRSQVRHRADDRQPQVARYLLGVAHFGIHAVEYNRAHHPESEAGQEAHQEQARRRVLERTLRHHCRIENPHVWNGGLGGEPGLIVALLQRRVRLLLQLRVAT